MAELSLNLESDISSVMNCLTQTALSQKTIRRKVLRITGKKAVIEIRKEIASSTARVSGELRQAYTYRVNKEATKAVMYARSNDQKTGKNKKKSIYPKLIALNYGAMIAAQKAKYLQISGKNFFARKKLVEIKGRGFLQRAWNRYLGSYAEDVQSIIDEELNKFWGR